MESAKVAEYNMINSAVESNDVEGVKALLLKYPTHVNLPLGDGRTPLHSAVIKNNVGMMQLLIANNAQVNPSCNFFNSLTTFGGTRGTLSPLWIATLMSHHQAAECLIRSGANVNERFGVNFSRKWQHYDYEAQSTFLHVAVHRQNAHLARLLLQHGADLSARNSRNRTPLYDALVADCPADLILEMINRGARHELTHVDQMQRTYLHPVISAANEELTQLLLEQPEIDAKLINNIGKTTLHFAAEARWESVKIAALLLEKGVDINAVDNVYRNTALHVAIRSGKLAMTKLLIEKGADVNAKNHEGFFPLYLAVEYSSLEVLDLLIAKGADLKQRTPAGQTALHIACNHGFEEKIKMLLTRGSDPMIEDEIGRTPFQMLKRERVGAARQMVGRLAAAKVAEKRQIDEKDWELIKAWNMQEYFKECAFELLRMKSSKMYRNVSLFHVFATSDKKLAMLMRNEDFVSSFDMMYFECRFPVYKDYFPPKMKRAEKIMKSHCAVENHLRMIFFNYFEEVTIRLLANYLTVEDLPGCCVSE